MTRGEADALIVSLRDVRPHLHLLRQMCSALGNGRPEILMREVARHADLLLAAVEKLRTDAGMSES